MPRKIRAVLVGCGGMSRAWLSALAGRRDAEVVGLVDIAVENARRRAGEFGLDKALVGEDLGAVLKETRPEAVFDVTVPEAHAQVALTALRCGCHVLGEKPMADSMASARRVLRAAQKAEKIYAVIQNRRYQAPIRRLRRLVESGRLGQIASIDSDFYIGAHFGGFRDRMRHVLLLDMAIHTFDQARLISGADPLSVYCREWNPRGSWYDHDAAAVAVFEMTGGLVYTYRGSWCAEGLNTSWESQWRIVGSKGSATWDGGEGIRAEVVNKKGGFHSQMKGLDIPPLRQRDRVGGHAGLIGEFLQCVRAGRQPETAGADNIRSLAMVFGAIDSAARGRPVKMGD